MVAVLKDTIARASRPATPAFLTQGFRPFFLAAGIWSAAALCPSRHLPAAKVKAYIDFVAEVVAGGGKPGEGGTRLASPASITAMASLPNRRAG